MRRKGDLVTTRLPCPQFAHGNSYLCQLVRCCFRSSGLVQTPDLHRLNRGWRDQLSAQAQYGTTPGTALIMSAMIRSGMCGFFGFCLDHTEW
jgi:hypothetical protein